MLPKFENGIVNKNSKDNIEIFNMFWHGDNLSPMEMCCVKSFIEHGHTLRVFTYQKVDLPQGVINEDASQILPYDELFMFDDSPAAFSNIFRYKLLLEQGGWWVDTDVVCLTENLPRCDFFWAEQNPGIINNAILKFPKGDPICEQLLRLSLERSKNITKWGQLGPLLLSEVLKNVKVSNHYGSTHDAYPVNYLETDYFWLPEFAAAVKIRTENSLFVHLWHQMFHNMGINLECNPPAGSFLSNLYQQYEQPLPKKMDELLETRQRIAAYLNQDWVIIELSNHMGREFIKGERDTLEKPIPRLSVIMPVFNAQSYLSEAIESILSQTYSNFNFFIIDDESTDDSLEIIRAAAKVDNRIVIIENSENVGQSESLNRGILASESEFIAIMDADDISLPFRFEKQIRFLDQNLEIDMCGTAYRELVDGQPGELIFLPKDQSEILASLLFFCPFVHPTVMFRRQTFAENDLFYNSTYCYSNDYELWSRALFIICSANISDDLFRYRVHSNQMSQNNDGSKDRLVLSKLLDQLEVVYSQDDLELQYAIMWFRTKNTPELAIAVEKWFTKLKGANTHSKLFPEPFFSNLANTYLLKIMQNIYELQPRWIERKMIKSQKNDNEVQFNNSTVSIIVPFFNRQNLIGETIESVLAQTYQNWELLLVDDGSSDGSIEIAENYARQFPQKIQCLQHEDHQNLGASASRQLGFNRSKGDLILFLDSDDILLPQNLEILASTLIDNSEADVLFSGNQYWFSWTQKPDDLSKDYIWEPWKSFGIPIKTIIAPPYLVHYLILNQVMPCIGSLIIKRETIHRIGGWEEKYKYSWEDQVFFLKLFMQASVYIMPGWFEKYRIHENSTTGEVNKTGNYLHDRIYFLSWVKNYLANQNYHDAQIDRFLEEELAPYKNPIDHSKTDVPLPVGIKSFGDLHRLSPISQVWGFDRGPIGRGNRAQNVDRYYIEDFLQRHAADIQGRVLEIGDSLYSHEFGGDRVTFAEVLDADPNNHNATYVYDLAVGGEGFPDERFDCFLLIQTLFLIYDVKAAIQNAYKLLKPGGILLVTLPGISQICVEEMEQWGDYWRFTSASVRKLFGDVFDYENITIETYGNVLSASAFLFSLGACELNKEELDFKDPNYQVTITLRAIKKEERETNNFEIKTDIQIAENQQAKFGYSKTESGKVRQFPLFVQGKQQIAKLIKTLTDKKRVVGRLFSLRKNTDLMNISTLFNPVWYLSNNPDVAKSRMSAAHHYLLYGGFEGRNPGPDFDSQWYLDHYPDIKQAGVNPLLHYIKFGKAEGRLPKSDA